MWQRALNIIMKRTSEYINLKEYGRITDCTAAFVNGENEDSQILIQHGTLPRYLDY